MGKACVRSGLFVTLVHLSIENNEAGEYCGLAHCLTAGMALAMWLLHHAIQSCHPRPGCRGSDRRAKCVSSAPSVIRAVLEDCAACEISLLSGPFTKPDQGKRAGFLRENLAYSFLETD